MKPKINATKKYYILMGVYCALAILDGLLTYIHTPDLSNEGNPLVAHFGLGWTALLMANLIVLALLGYFAHYSFVRYKTVVVNCRNRREYISLLFFNRPDKFSWMLYRLPKNWKPFAALMGYIAIYSLIIMRMILVIEWAFPLPSAYYALQRQLPFGRVDTTIGIFVMVFLLYRWFDKEYLTSKSACIPIETE